MDDRTVTAQEKLFRRPVCRRYPRSPTVRPQPIVRAPTFDAFDALGHHSTLQQRACTVKLTLALEAPPTR